MSKGKNVVLSLNNITKTFTQGSLKLHVLQGASLQLKAGEMVGLVGASGSGKTTLLQITGLLDKADAGTIKIGEVECSGASDKVRTRLRRDEIGFVYQFHHLLPEFSALENVVIPQMVAGISKKEAVTNAKEVLKYLGLSRRETHRPAELSGGEQQRVAIARAVANKPSILLADEPTGNLDPGTALEVFNLLVNTARDIGLAMLIVTHNTALAAKMDRVLTIRDGALIQKRKL